MRNLSAKIPNFVKSFLKLILENLQEGPYRIVGGFQFARYKLKEKS